jgi:hypothetical protein
MLTTPGFAAESSFHSSGRYRPAGQAPDDTGRVEPAIPPCHACDRIIDLCINGRLRGAVCRFCAVGYCDPQDWKTPGEPFPRSEPWDFPF